jgi:hypothetical protein
MVRGTVLRTAMAVRDATRRLQEYPSIAIRGGRRTARPTFRPLDFRHYENAAGRRQTHSRWKFFFLRNQPEVFVMNKLAMFAAATGGTVIQSLAFAAPNLLVTTQSPIDVTTATPPVAELVNEGDGSGSGTTCQRASVGAFYCTIDGKDYVCTTDKNPDKNKDCVAMSVVQPPRRVWQIAPVGILRAQ